MGRKDPSEVAARYTAIWNEPDAARRRRLLLRCLLLRLLRLTPGPRPRQRRHAELEGRVTSAYEQFVATGQMSFRARDDAARIGDAVKWRWEGVSPDGEIVGVGLELVLLAPDGRIQTDYQFIES